MLEEMANLLASELKKKKLSKRVLSVMPFYLEGVTDGRNGITCVSTECLHI